jgi:hypothetical protein
MDRDSPGRNLRRAGLLEVRWSSGIEGLLEIFWRCRDRLYGSYRLTGAGSGRRIGRGLVISSYLATGWHAYLTFQILYVHRSRSSPLDQSRMRLLVVPVQAKHEHIPDVGSMDLPEEHNDK